MLPHPLGMVVSWVSPLFKNSFISSGVMRKSNLELMRIVAMFFIVLHHYVVSSGVVSYFDYENPTHNLYLLRVLGAWGKPAINAFVLITGYFMCTGSSSIWKFFKILFVWLFYSTAVFCIFALFGRQEVTVGNVVRVLFALFFGVDHEFTPSFLWFYLGIPFYNQLITNLSKKQMYLLVLLMCALFVVPATFFQNRQVFHHVFWYIAMYFVGAMIRKYPLWWMDNNYVCLPLLMGSLSLVTFALCGRLVNDSFMMKIFANVCNVNESCLLMSLIVGCLVFLVFKNINMGCHVWINRFASTMFGVLCIHAASDPMRKWLWNDCCRVGGAYSFFSAAYLLLHALSCVAIIMVVCAGIDLMRGWIMAKICKSGA